MRGIFPQVVLGWDCITASAAAKESESDRKSGILSGNVLAALADTTGKLLLATEKSI
jgi:acyl-coenzyme A thioesterase PaaI-like protein